MVTTRIPDAVQPITSAFIQNTSGYAPQPSRGSIGPGCRDRQCRTFARRTRRRGACGPSRVAIHFQAHAMDPREQKQLVRDGYDAVSEIYQRRAEGESRAAYDGWLDELTPLLPPASPVLDLGSGCGLPVARRLT